VTTALTPPDIFLLILDCVRAQDFPSSGDDPPPMPFVQSLRPESAVFPRAASVSPWTVPSHATLLTGLYPWEHGAHAKRSLVMDPGLPRLPDRLRRAGYRTLLLSANPLLCPPTGFTQGFDAAAWGSEFDRYLRISTSPFPPNTHSLPKAEDGAGARFQQAMFRRLPHEEVPIVPWLDRHVPWLSNVNRLVTTLRDGHSQGDFAVGRWIEPTLARWLASQSPDQPVFVMVNLCDAHEPYFADREALRTIGGARRFGRLHQDRYTWIRERDRLPSDERAALRTLYRSAVARLDSRIRGLVTAFREAGRWDRTLFALTSDHGQAFGEHGALFHRFRVDESLLRIPLWVRYPDRTGAGARAMGWASLVDLFPTFLGAAGGSLDPSLPGRPLDGLIDQERGPAAFAISDGTVGEPWIPDEAQTEFNRLWVAAYVRDSKVTYDAESGAFHLWQVDQDPEETRDLWGAEGARLGDLPTRMMEISHQMTAKPVVGPTGPVADRLRSWGYL
jgi:arylsulfatase A-like enzyme